MYKQHAKLDIAMRTFFIKWNQGHLGDMFLAEAKGLKLLFAAGAIKIPEVISYENVERMSFMLMEFIETVPASKLFWGNFGNSLAKLHKTSNAKFGLDHDNFIGSLPQKNTSNSSWVEFFIENRLSVQAGLAFYNGHVSIDFLKKLEKVYKKLPDLLPEDKPALLNGDLWSGNFIVQIMPNPV